MFKNQNGAVLILITIALPVLLGFAALAIDTGYMYMRKGQYQSMVDAASLAGAMELPDQASAQAKVTEYIGLNGGGPAAVSFPAADQIQVDSTSTASLFFGPVLGINTAAINTTARARRGQFGLLGGRGININMNLVDFGPPSFINGDIHANGNITLNQSPVLQYGEVTAAGTTTPAGAGTSNVYAVAIDPVNLASYQAQAIRIYNMGSQPDWPAGILFSRQGRNFTFNLNGNWAGNIYYVQGPPMNPPTVMSNGDARDVTVVIDNNVTVDNLSSQLLAGDPFSVFVIASGNIAVNPAVTTLSGIVFRSGGAFSFDSSVNGFIPGNIRVAADGNINIDIMWDGITGLDFHTTPQPPFPYIRSWAGLIN